MDNDADGQESPNKKKIENFYTVIFDLTESI